MAAGRLRGWLRPTRVGIVVAVVVLTLLYVPAWAARLRDPAAVTEPRFPSTIASYSGLTAQLAAGEMEAASLYYQNGVGVEFLDEPMAVLLGADGTTYRQFRESEALSIPEDQGDPAATVLSPDGTFVVIGGAGPTGEIVVATLRDSQRRKLSVGEHRVALPTAIAANARIVLLAVSESTVNKYAVSKDLGLASIDLVTGKVRDYPGFHDIGGAAPSPDGRLIAVATDNHIELIRTDSGTRSMQIPVDVHRDPRCDIDDESEDEDVEGEDVEGEDASEEEEFDCQYLGLDANAWSPDGRQIAATLGSEIAVVDLSGSKPALHRVPVKTPGSGEVILGWRDESTVLMHATTDTYENTSEMFWFDLRTGAVRSFATYTPNFTGAAMVGVDAARNLIPHWQVGPRPIDRGPMPLWAASWRAAAAGLLAMLLTAIVRGLVARGQRRTARSGATPS